MMPVSSRQRQGSARDATRTLKKIPICKLSSLAPRGYVAETNISVDSRADVQDIPTTYRTERFDDLPDFPSLVDNGRSDRKGVSANNEF